MQFLSAPDAYSTLSTGLEKHDGVFGLSYIYRVTRNDCRGFNNLSCTIHLR